MNKALRTGMVQTLVLHRALRRILLVQWQQGPFRGRWTGLIGRYEPPRDRTPEAAASRHALALGGASISQDLLRARRRALLHFTESAGWNPQTDQPTQVLEQSSELQYVVFADVDQDVTVDLAGVAPEDVGAIPRWFDVDAIPYEAMPDDDELWYPSVIDADRTDQCCTGEFFFTGPTLQKHSIDVVDSSRLEELVVECAAMCAST